MKLTLLTSRNWEGAFILKELLDNKLQVENILLQKTWWREINSYEYSKEYKLRCENKKNLDTLHYFLIEELINDKQIQIFYIENINNNDSIRKFEFIESDVLIVVGARILKPSVINKFGGMIINFHTGYLPQYRGPYSEFWAMYNNDYSHIGTTIHLIDEGIDTGMILEKVKTEVPKNITPSEAHVLNTINGAQLMVNVLKDIKKGKFYPSKQDERKAKYYSFPTDEEIKDLEIRLNKKINISFAD